MATSVGDVPGSESSESYFDFNFQSTLAPLLDIRPSGWQHFLVPPEKMLLPSRQTHREADCGFSIILQPQLQTHFLLCEVWCGGSEAVWERLVKEPTMSPVSWLWVITNIWKDIVLSPLLSPWCTEQSRAHLLGERGCHSGVMNWITGRGGCISRKPHTQSWRVTWQLINQNLSAVINQNHKENSCWWVLGGLQTNHWSRGWSWMSEVRRVLGLLSYLTGL